MSKLLQVHNLTKKFGGLTAVNDISLEIEDGEIHGIIGPNGAGKTTLFSLIGGALPSTSGQVIFKGQDISSLSSHQITKLGLARTFQRSVVFSGFSVLENILLAMHTKVPSGILQAIVNFGPTYPKEEVERALSILDFVGLSSHQDLQAETLALGHQRSLGIALALATSPKLLMLDEPAAGMNASEAMELDALIRRVNKEQGISVILVEHDMKLVMEVCDQITAINFGSKIASGSPKEIYQDKNVIEAYLGTDEMEEEAL